MNLAAGPYIAYSMGDKNIAVYNEYTRVIVAVMKVMALSIMEVMEVICMVADGRERF